MADPGRQIARDERAAMCQSSFESHEVMLKSILASMERLVVGRGIAQGNISNYAVATRNSHCDGRTEPAFIGTQGMPASEGI